jgi:acetyltransferase-like isoleucine patch superfamily enzyme
MKAILIHTAAWRPPGLGLAPIVGRPLVLHVLESLIRHGAREIEVLHDGSAPELPAILGDGVRFGVRVRCFEVPGEGLRAETAEALCEDAVGAVLVARSDRLPCLSELEDEPEHLVLEVSGVSRGRSLGWARLPIDRVGEFLRHGVDRPLAPHLATVPRLQLCQPVLGDGPLADVVESNHAVLTANPWALTVRGERRASGVVVDHHASLGPEVVLIPPLYIGAGSVVERGAVLGPDVYLGEGALVAERARLERVVVDRRTAVGPGVHLREAVARGASLHRTSFGLEKHVEDPAILADLTCPRWSAVSELGRGLRRLLGLPSTDDPLEVSR